MKQVGEDAAPRKPDASEEASGGIFAYDKWLERRGNTPREVIDRKRIKAILGVLK
jgi:hypothetical protein